MTTAHIDTLRGKTGRIYISRKGTVMVFVTSEGETYLANCASPSNTLACNPVADYWIHSIDWAASRGDYIAFGMTRDQDDRPFYPHAETLAEHREAQP